MIMTRERLRQILYMPYPRYEVVELFDDGKYSGGYLRKSSGFDEYFEGRAELREYEKYLEEVEGVSLTDKIFGLDAARREQGLDHVSR